MIFQQFINEAKREDAEVNQRFSKFIDELQKLSLKYDIMIQSTGSVNIYQPGEIKTISYSKDYTSGDLDVVDLETR